MCWRFLLPSGAASGILPVGRPGLFAMKAIHVLFSILLLLIAASGCSDYDPNAPMTDDLIRITSNTNLFTFTLEDPATNKQYHLLPREYEAGRELIRALIPIKTHKKGRVSSPQYRLLFQGGNSPADIYVRRLDGMLEFHFEGLPYVYTGGSADRFISVYEKTVSSH